MQIIDTCGKLCPAPLIITKNAIKTAQINDQLQVVCDNETAKNNLITYLTELGYQPLCDQQENIFRITFTKSVIEKNLAPEQYCSTDKTYVVAIKNEHMGGGDPTLGAILMRAFINALPEADKQPTHIVIYNSGVRVALKGCDTASSLKKLADNGVQIIVCGTCVDFYEVKEQLAVGTIGNMYKITEILSQTGHVVYP